MRDVGVEVWLTRFPREGTIFFQGYRGACPRNGGKTDSLGAGDDGTQAGSDALG